jgi:GT2 family glycosyltransferase
MMNIARDKIKTDNAQPSVSVIIPHYNDVDNLAVCLSKLSTQTYPSALVEIIVADNNSRCGLDTVIAAVAGRAKVILATEQGAGPARNAAVAAATGEVLAFIDSDCVPDERWIELGVRALDGRDIVGGRVDVVTRDPRNPTAVEAFETVFAFDMKAYIIKKSFVGSGNLFVLRSVFQQIGGFRKTVSEDTEWSHRAIGCGYSINYANDVVVSHPARSDWQQLVKKWQRLTHEGFAYHRMQGRSCFSWIARSFVVLASPIPHSLKIITTKRLADAETKMKAIGILFLIRAYRFLMMLREVAAAEKIS